MSVSISLYELTKKHDLDAYVDQCVEADDVMVKGFQTTIDKLIVDLQKNLPAELKPVRIVKGGSLCKGTSTIGSCDIDLILMLPNYHDIRSLRGDLHKLLKQLQSCTEELDNVRASVRADLGVHLEYTDSMGDCHDVDVMVAVDVLSTEEGGAKTAYELMKTRDSGLRTYYYSSLVPLHNQVFKEIHAAKLKKLIRLAKFWKKEREMVFRTANRGDNYTRWPPSYVIEVLILVLWTRAASPYTFSLRKAMYSILKIIVSHRELVIVPENRLLNYDRKIVERSDCGPYIMDPCNPFNNLYLTPRQRSAWNWDDIAQEAQYFLDRPVFQNVTGALDRW